MDKINVKRWIRENSQYFTILRDKPIKIKLNGKQLTDNALFQYLAPTRITDLGSLAPEKVLGENGKWETPKCFDVVFDQGILTFSISTTRLNVGIKGVVLVEGANITNLEVYT